MNKRERADRAALEKQVLENLAKSRIISIDVVHETNEAYERGYQVQALEHRAELELNSLIDHLSEIVQCTTEVITFATATATWQALREYLRVRKSHDSIVGAKQRLNVAVARQHETGVFIVKSDNTVLAAITNLIDELTQHIDDFERGKIEGETLAQFVISRASHKAAYDLFMSLKRVIDLGGAPVKQWRMILAQRVEEIQAETGVTQHGALTFIMDEIKFMDNPSEEWQIIFSEIDKRRTTKRSNWIKRIMKDYRSMTNLQVT